MSDSSKQSYLLLSRTGEWCQQLSAAELQELNAANKAWEGATVFARNQRVVLDGPYPESKEAICGTLVLEVANLDEAITIAKACSSLRYGGTIEIRPISGECPLEGCARTKGKAEQLAPATV